MDDFQLLAKIAKGDSKSFESLVRRHEKVVYGMSLRILGAPMLAEENSQETWIRVVTGAPDFKPLAPVLAWILKITKNLALNTIEKRGWEESLSEESEKLIPNSDEDFSLTLEKAQDIQILKEAINKLPDRQRVALVLWMHEEKSYSELAQELRIDINAVKALLFRAKENIEKQIKEVRK